MNDTMHHVEFEVKLTGSKLFDLVMYNTARKLCADFPGLDFDYGKTEIKISGELNDYWYDKFNETMFSNYQQLN